MPRKNNTKETGDAVQEAKIEITDTTLDEISSAFEENDTETNENDMHECEEKSGVFITLKKGGSYHYNEWKFIKNEPVPVDSEIAEKLMKTGFFVLSGA